MRRFSKVFEVLIIFVLSLTPILWLRDGQVVLGHDSGFRLDIVDYWKNLFYSWNPIANFGGDWTMSKGFLVAQFPEVFFTHILNSLSLGEIAAFIFWFFAIGISMYVFVNSFYKEQKFWFLRIFASIFYMYNFFLLQAWFIAERAKFSIYVALPLCVLILYKTLTRKISLWKGLFFFSLLFFFFNAGGAPTFLGSFLVIFITIIIYFAITNYRKGGLGELVHIAKVSILFLVGFFLVNAYWVIPQLYLVFHQYASSLEANGGVSGIIGWESTISKYASFINLLRLEGIPDWYKNLGHPYSSLYLNNVLLIIFSFLFPIILVGSLALIVSQKWKNHNKQLLLLMLALFLIGIVFTAGSHPPLGFLYILFIEHIPGFPIFRSSFYKFGIAFWFPAIFLISYGLYTIFAHFIKNRIAYVFFSVLTIILILAFHFPYFNASFFTWNPPYTTRVKVPSYVTSMSAYINTLPANTRILLLPSLDPVFHADMTDWNFWSLDLLPRLTTTKSIVADSEGAPAIIGAMYSAIEHNDEEQFLRMADIAGINKLLWRDDAIYGDGMKAGLQLHYKEETIKNFRSLHLLKQEDRWRLYDIAYANPPPTFYVPKNIETTLTSNSSVGQLMAERSTSSSALLEYADLSSSNLSSKDYVQARCVLCEPHAFSDIIGKTAGPQLRLLPNSKLYFFVEVKEYLTLKRIKNPETAALVNMTYSYKRIVEINNLLRKNNESENFNKEVFSNVPRFKESVNNAMREANLLPIEKRNSLLIKIYAYLYHEDRNADTFIRNNEANGAIDDLELFIIQKMNVLEKTIWVTKDQADKKYFITVPSTGDYALVFTNIGQVLPNEIYLDGKRINAQGVRVEQGTHKLEVTYSPLENMLVKPINTETSFTILSGGEERLSLKPLSYANLYIVSFDYRHNNGIAPNIKITQDATVNEDKYELTRQSGDLLSKEGTWNHYEYVMGGDPNSKNFSLDFFTCCKNGKNSAFSIKNLQVTRLFEPGVNFLAENTKVRKTQVENISYKQLDPTTYIVSVRNANAPYILSSRIGYDPSWKALTLGSPESSNSNYLSTTVFRQDTQENRSYKTNTFANAWLINKPGSYDILIEYEPQRFFYIGSLISLVSFPILGLLFLFKGRK